MELEMNNDIFIKVSELLENGAKERDHDFHIMTFCTIGKEGVEARSVVLRDLIKIKILFVFTPIIEVQNLMILRKTQTQFSWYIVIS